MEVLSLNITEAVDSKTWNPVYLSRKGPALSHLFFADDIILMSYTNTKSCKTVAATLLNFCSWAGQNINNSKSKILFSHNYTKKTQQTITFFFQIKSCSSLGKYLGFSLFHKPHNNADFLYILDNLKRRLSGWKTNFISIVGRITLEKSCLKNIPTHVMHYL